MKKLVLATALVAAFSSQVMAASTSTVGGTVAGKATDGSTPGANSGIVRFKGKVVDQTCTIDGNSQDQIVVLDTVSKNRFTATEKTAMPTPFEIKLSGCTLPTATNGKAPKVKARFASVANVDTANNYTLKNTKAVAAGGAANVNIQLFNEDGTTAISPMKRVTTPATTTTPVTHKSDDGAIFKDITAENQTLRYVAKYYATTASVGVGEVESAVDFELTYE
ncbi:fimbrial protein [Haemophilus haemolyticus]|uniref:fimbrial protein n=1 Tax=Haemophilus haemolyticus TaxID=726 RepID=UPI000E0DABD6|nr:fimbrial protein [Haemophilus haemolyticus]